MAAVRRHKHAPAAKRGVELGAPAKTGPGQARGRKRPPHPDRSCTDESLPEAAQAAAIHIPVLFHQVLSFLEPKPGQRYLDATLGMGGHAAGMLQKARDQGVFDAELLGLDRDLSALALARDRLSSFGNAVHTRHCRFSDSGQALADLGWDRVDFILADIGVSSLQLDQSERGFSFLADGPLDMRMDSSQGKSAESLVNETPVSRLKEMIRELGEDPMAGRIARAIDTARAQKRITGTLELARIVEQAYPAKWRATARNHPATRTFQALRMAVNEELAELDSFLRKSLALLRPGGRVAVIAFHSLEDRMVKHFFREQASGCHCPRHMTQCVCGQTASLLVLTRKPVKPTTEETLTNPRAASAKLRVAERTTHG